MEGYCTLIAISLSLSLSQYKLQISTYWLCKLFANISTAVSWARQIWDLNILSGDVSFLYLPQLVCQSEISDKTEIMPIFELTISSSAVTGGRGRDPLEIFVWSRYHLVWCCPSLRWSFIWLINSPSCQQRGVPPHYTPDVSPVSWHEINLVIWPHLTLFPSLISAKTGA